MLSVAEDDIFLYFVKMTLLLFLKKVKISSFVTFDGVQLPTGLINSHKVWGVTLSDVYNNVAN